MQESITIPIFKDYEELFLILQAVFQIFEDFKGVFLARLARISNARKLTTIGYMIPTIEQQIYIDLNFTNRLLKIYQNYTDAGFDVPIFKKKEIIALFKEISYPCKYIIGGAYVISKAHNNYRFDYSFVINKNAVNTYFYIYLDEILIEPRATNIGTVLWYIPYDEKLINPNYKLNNMEELKSFILEIIALLDEVVATYIQQLA